MPIISSCSTVPNNVHLYLIMAEIFGRDGNFRKFTQYPVRVAPKKDYFFNVDKNMIHPEEIVTFMEHNSDFFFFFF